MTNPKIRSQYVETLIALVKLNTSRDVYVSFFEGFRKPGTYLPAYMRGLDDNGPYFSGEKENIWYIRLFEIIRYLFAKELEPQAIFDYKEIKLKNNLRILRCQNCNGRYQHPRIFETHLALTFYKDNFVKYVHEAKLEEIVHSKNSFNSDDSEKYRNWLQNQYDKNKIKVYDFVTEKYICPHCGLKSEATSADLFKIKSNLWGLKSLKFIQSNASQSEFEKV